jgi:hypothetical protein
MHRRAPIIWVGFKLLLLIFVGLALGTEYEMSVMSYNDIGDSDYSVEVVVAKTSSKLVLNESYLCNTSYL